MKIEGLKVNPYVSALKEFIRGSIQDPDFFNLPRYKQQKMAMNTIQKHKTELYQPKEVEGVC